MPCCFCSNSSVTLRNGSLLAGGLLRSISGGWGAAMTTGGREASSSAFAENGVGSLIISLHICKHSSQIYAAPGPATIRRTSDEWRPQNEQRANDRSKLITPSSLVSSTWGLPSERA